MDFGYSSAIYYEFDLMSVLPLFREAGIKYIELSSGLPHLDCCRPDTARELGKKLNELSLKPYSAHLPFGTGLDIASLDRNHRKQAVGKILESCAFFKEVNENISFVLHPGGSILENSGHRHGAGNLTDKNYESVRLAMVEASIKSVMELARAYPGNRFCMETHFPPYLGGSIDDIHRIISTIDRENVGVCIDTSHVNLHFDPVKVVRLFGKKIYAFHLSDNYKTYDSHFMPGEGTVKWDDFFSNVEDIGFAGIATIEVLRHDYTLSKYELMKQAYRRFTDLHAECLNKYELQKKMWNFWW